MHRRISPALLLAGLGALALACANPFAEKSPELVPDEAPAEVVPVTPQVHAPDASGTLWPLLKMEAVPGGRSVAVPADVLDVDVEPQGRFAVVVTGTADTSSVWTWDFAGALVPVVIEGVREVAFSPFDGELYVVRHAGKWTIEHGAALGGRWTSQGTTYTSDAALSALVPSFTRYDDAERVFFAREAAPGRTQILGVRRSGERPYEVTSPSGTLGELTAPEVRTPPEEAWAMPPVVLQAESAIPRSVHPVTGALLWSDGAGQTHARAWTTAEGNWAEDLVVAAAPPGEVRTWSPNGYYAIAWAPDGSVRFADPEGGAEPIPGARFRSAPVSAANGRTLVGWTDAGLSTVTVPLPLAPVRYLGAAGYSVAIRGALAGKGLAVEDSKFEQLYEVYDDILYGYPEKPVFASVDGLLEVLHVGFQAVFVRVEREVSRPRLEAFLTALEAAAQKGEEKRVREIAIAAKRMLAGDYAFPEGDRVKAETLAESELHHETIDFQDFHPRGPYATSEDLANYFRAFKYIDRLQLTDEERASLLSDTALVSAWKAWVDTQAPYLSGTRYEGMFGEGWDKSPYVRPECLPKLVRDKPRRVFPLSWGRDSEILERTVAHDDLGPGCTVPERVMPSGLDLLTAFGSPASAAIQRAEYARYPELETTHAALRERFSGDVPSERFVDGWMRLVQLLGNEAHVPEGVTPEVWHARLMETALASWTSFRHTTVLVNEGTAGQMGDGGDAVFETLSVEPVRGVVDPVPAAWSQTADLLGTLATAAKATPTTDQLATVLTEASAAATRFEGIARKQMANEPISEEDYRLIERFAGVVEHPYLLLSAAAAGKPDELAAPEPMMRIVDIHTWNNPQGPAEHWHAAVGRPRAITVLLGDRGILVPGTGAVYGYHEVIADHRLDDAEWRKVVDTAARPAWTNPSLR